MKTPHAVRPNSVKVTLASSALGRDGQPLIRDSQPAWEHSPAELVGIAAKFQPEVFMGHRYTSHTHTPLSFQPESFLPQATIRPPCRSEGGNHAPRFLARCPACTRRCSVFPGPCFLHNQVLARLCFFPTWHSALENQAPRHFPRVYSTCMSCTELMCHLFSSNMSVTA